MAQGWDVDATADTITFYEAPANGADIDVYEFAQASYNATDVWAFGAWSEEFGYPKEVEFFSDRLIFAGTVSDPQTLWMSQTGDYTNFGRSTPIIDSDSITLTINSRKVNEVNDLVGLDSLLILTKGAEWKLDTGNTAVVAPDTVGFSPQSYNGSNTVPAVVVDTTALYVQRKSQSVRELSADSSYTGKYNGRDITAFSSHLLEGHTIVEWAYQQHPFSIVWAVRDDGILLCLTYMKEHDVVGWTRVETDGIVESVCVVPESEEDVVYVVVKREIPGLSAPTRRNIEHLSSRIIEDIREATFLDSFLVFDGRITDGTPITASNGPYVVGNTYTLTATGKFASTDVGDYVVMYYDAGNNGGLGFRFQITEYTSANVVTGLLETPVDVIGNLAAVTDWAFGRNSISGLGHLVGKTVGILADGEVLDDQVVPAGAMTIAPPSVIVCAGLKYVSDMETLEVNAPGAETLMTKAKLIKELGLVLQESRSVRLGPDFGHLDEIDAHQSTSIGLPDLLDGVFVAPIRSGWAERGRFCIRQSDPLPISILGVIPDFKEGK
jgi:hypothetical protein